MEFLIEEYRYHKLPDKALALAWKRYEGRPELQYYKALHTYCVKSEWPALREQALKYLAQAGGTTCRATPRRCHQGLQMADQQAGAAHQ